MVRHVACATLLATVAVTQAQSTDQVLLSLKRDYGRALYTQCRLNIVVFARQGRASLWCAPSMAGGKQLSAERALSSPEAKDLPPLVMASDLCTLGHTGRDDTASDGIFETLQTRCPGGNVAVLVTSGNPTFTTNDARRRLLDRLYILEEDLRRSAPLSK